MPYSYRKSERLKKNEDFVSTMKGKRLSFDGLSLFYAQNSIGNFRVGISVSKKVANAVKRNRVRRQIRSSIMRILKNEQKGYDLVFIARRGFVSMDFLQMLNTVEKALLQTVLRKKTSDGVVS